MDNISIERIWQDEHMYEIRVFAKNDFVQAVINIYIQDISDLANLFIAYPHDNLNYEWQHGDDDKGLSFRVIPKDKLGHLLVKIEMLDEWGLSANHFRCCLNIETEIGMLNSFGERLIQINQSIIGTKIILNEYAE